MQHTNKNLKGLSFWLYLVSLFCVVQPAQATPTSYTPEIVRNIDELQGFNELVPYVLPSPQQEDAGSCLYMSLTGIAEWWLARLNPAVSRRPNGPLDLSERHLINISENKKYQKNVQNILVRILEK